MVWKRGTCGPQKEVRPGWGGGGQCWGNSHSGLSLNTSPTRLFRVIFPEGSAVWTYFQALLLPLQAASSRHWLPLPHPKFSLPHSEAETQSGESPFRPHARRPSLSTLGPHGPSARHPLTSPSCPLSRISMSVMEWIVHDMSYVYFIHSLHLLLTHTLIMSVCLLQLHAWCRARSGAVCWEQCPESQLCQGAVGLPVAPDVGPMEAIPVSVRPKHTVLTVSWWPHGFVISPSQVTLKISCTLGMPGSAILQKQVRGVPGEPHPCHSPAQCLALLSSTHHLDRVVSQNVGFFNS